MNAFLNKKNYLNFIKLLIFLFCFYIILKNILKEDKAIEIISSIDIKYVLIIFILNFLLKLIESNFIFNIIRISTNSDVKFYQWNKIFFDSQIFSMLLTSSGFFYRAIKLRIFSISFGDVIKIQTFLAWFYMFFCLILYTIEIIIFASDFYVLSYSPIPFLFSLISIIFFAPFFILFFFPKKIHFAGSLIQWIYDKAWGILSFSKDNLFNKKLLPSLINFGITAHLIQFLMMFILIKSLNLNIDFGLIIIFFVINSFLDQIPITPKNIGVSEVILALVAIQSGLIFSEGLMLKIVLRIINACIIMLVAFFLNLKKIDRLIS